MKKDTRKIKEDYVEEGPQLCELDRSKTYKGLFGIYVDESLITSRHRVLSKWRNIAYSFKENSKILTKC